MKKNIETAEAYDAPCPPAASIAPIDWAQRFHAVTQAPLQAQLVHRELQPLWVNLAFVHLFQFRSVSEALSCACLCDLLTPELGGWFEQRRAGSVYGRRVLCRRDGARFPADVYGRPVMWDGASAASLSIVDATEEETALGDLSDHPSRGGWRYGSLRPRRRRRPRRVLLANSSAERCDAIAAILGRIGCAAKRAASPETALAACASPLFDLVLIDLDGPNREAGEGPAEAALDLARRIRALPAPHGGAPIIALARRVDEAARDAIAEAGMDAYLRFPVAPRRLIEAIAALTRSIDPAELDDIEQEHEQDKARDDIDGDHGLPALSCLR